MGLTGRIFSLPSTIFRSGVPVSSCRNSNPSPPRNGPTIAPGPGACLSGRRLTPEGCRVSVRSGPLVVYLSSPTTTPVSRVENVTTVLVLRLLVQGPDPTPRPSS